MTNLEIIKSACVRVNPSIMELGFGCELLYGDVRTRFMCHFDKEYYEIFPTVNGNNTVYHTEIIILGRPIRLADVLLAIYRSGSVPHKEGTTTGENYWKAIVDVVANAKKGWNLLKDNLEDQSPETLQFIADLLK